MEIILVITSLFIALAVMLTPCASHQHFHVSSSLDHQDHELQHHRPTLPRKLKVNVVVQGCGVKDKVSCNNYNPKEVSPEKHRHKDAENEMRARRGTRQEWVQGTDPSGFFSMDYSHVRRRRPIHNKSLPVGP